MNKRIHRAAAATGSVAIGTILLAGPALASQRVPDGGSAVNVTSSQAARVRADLQDLREQASVVPHGPSVAGDPSTDLPYLQVGLGLVAVAAIAGGTMGIRTRRHHGTQPA